MMKQKDRIHLFLKKKKLGYLSKINKIANIRLTTYIPHKNHIFPAIIGGGLGEIDTSRKRAAISPNLGISATNPEISFSIEVHSNTIHIPNVNNQLVESRIHPRSKIESEEPREERERTHEDETKSVPSSA